MRWLHLILSALALPLIAGCSDEPRQDSFIYTDILTLISYDRDAGSLIGHDGMSLSAPAFHPDTTVIHAGDRFLGAYINEADNVITIKAIGTVSNLQLIAKPLTEVDPWDEDPVWLTSASLDSGRYLNLRLRLPYDAEPRQFFMLADDTDLYLIHRRPHPGDTFDRTYYASADLQPLIDAGIRQITLHIADKNTRHVTSLNFIIG